MKKNTKLIIAVIALVVVIAALLCVYAVTRPETSQGAKTFTVEVVHADGSTRTFTYHTDEEYLGAVLLAEGLIAGEESQYGLSTAIGLVKSTISSLLLVGSYWVADKACGYKVF